MFNSLKTIFIYSKGYIYVAELQFHMFNSLNTIFIYSKGYIYVAELQFHMFNSTQYLFTVKVTFMLQSYNFICSIH